MSSKRESDEQTGGDTKKPKPESTTEGMQDNDFKYYSPGSIFHDKDNDPTEMAGSTNFLLAESFYHSRYTTENQAKASDRGARFDRNAGALQLYKKDGVSLYAIPGQEKFKEYNFVSYGNKVFKDYTVEEFETEVSTYGHSERILMQMVLDDLISGHGDNREIQRPSDRGRSSHEIYEILKTLTDDTQEYRGYLENKGIIVKMWSERPSCSGVGAGGGCSTFMKNICPNGSKFGWIVKDYKREDNMDGGPKVEAAFEEFRKAYLEYHNPSKNVN